MKRLMSILFYISAMMALRPQTAGGQGRAGEGTWGFVNVRYDTQSPASIYTGYGWHAGFAMGGVTHNPRTGYAELIGGVGAIVRTGTSEHWLAFATAGTGTGSFAQIYWLPMVRMRAATARAQVKWTVGYNRRTVQKLSISPLSVTVPLGRQLSAGVATDISAVEGGLTRIGTGFELRVKLPRAIAGVDALRSVRGDGSRLRLFFASLF